MAKQQRQQRIQLTIFDALLEVGDRVTWGNDPRVWTVRGIKGDRLELHWVVQTPLPHTRVITWARVGEVSKHGA